MKSILVPTILIFLLNLNILFSQENSPNPSDDLNWVSSIRYDLSGNTIAKSVNYFNSLGKSTQSQSWDLITQKIWNSETRYDYHGRPALQTLSAPIGMSFGYQPNFIKKSNYGTYTTADFETSPFNPAAVGVVSNTLGAYYSTSNSTEPYQDITSYPFRRTIYSKLNPGAVKAVVGGNKTDTNNDGLINHLDTWLQTYSFSMPAPSQAAGVTKTVSRDVHGVEVVVFTDAEGNTIKAARSGNEDGVKPKKTVYSTIKELGYVDVHIPKGCRGISIVNPTTHQLKVYNLITELPVPTHILPHIQPGFYRIAVRDINNYTYNPSQQISVRHQINYYDFSTNSYDKAGRLLRSTQPNGSDLLSQFKYNSLGQLLETTSPDEGKAQFKYRKDGQIRFSQNSKQKEAAEFSYTHYDSIGRPIESGVLAGNFSAANPEQDALPSGTKKEQHFTLYDLPDSTGLEVLKASGQLSKRYLSQKYVAGNVSKTYTKNPATNTTWYSYDVYGRVEWMIQNIEGLGVKTIDYTYDFAQGHVTKVEYQKHNPNERFIHRYTYNDAGQLTQVETAKDTNSYTLQATYEYYETGALKRTELADGIQGTDYVYNLNGQLKSINHPALSAAKDPGQDANDLFGMQIDYHAFDYARTQRSNITSAAIGTNQYNGNIKNTRWNTSGSLPSPREHVYSYTYNKNNWLSGANFSATDNTPSPFPPDIISTAITNAGQTLNLKATNSITLKPGFHAKTGSLFSAKIEQAPLVIPEGDYDVSNITYDANGNIQTLKRNKNTENGSNRMDELTYAYKTDKPNQLQRVDDAVTTATNANDIKDQTSVENYIYNSIGQLIENKDEHLKYAYNAAGLVTEVQKNGTPRVRFYYNDRGHRIKKESILPSGTTTTYYVRDAAGSPMAIYQSELLATPGAPGYPPVYVAVTKLEEHPIYGSSRLGVHYRQSGTDMYQLTDHLGNVRAVIMKNGGNAVSLTAKTDYYPFGMPMPNRNIEGNYRYGYQGEFAEKDEETGLNAFQLRMYDSRIGRWLVPDPKNEFFSPYLAMGNNPIVIIDPTGGVTSGGGCPDPPCDGAGNVLLNEVVITGHNPGSSGWSDLIGRLSNLAQQTGATIGVFTLNALGTQANNNVTFGLYALPDPSNFGDYEGAARFGRLAGNINSIIQGAGLDIIAGGGEVLTVGAATPLAAPVAIHGTAVAVAGSVGTAGEISGLVNYFSKNSRHNAGKGEPIPKGFKETKEFGRQHGQKVYKYKNKYYSKDIDSHKGGVWKVFEKIGGKLKRIGTADANLKIIAK